MTLSPHKLLLNSGRVCNGNLFFIPKMVASTCIHSISLYFPHSMDKKSQGVTS
jgi:hypothetical protein